MTYRIAFPVAALLVAGGCSGRDATGPMSQNRSPSVNAAVSSLTATVPANESRVQEADVDNGGAHSPRSGILHVTKECLGSGLAGDFCTITSSNLKEIKVGWRVVYASAAGPTRLNSDVVLGPPGGGPNTAFGHCDVSNANTGTNLGLCTFSGGTGKFTHFRGRFVVSGNDLLGIVFHWDGPYSFGGKGGRGDKD